MGGAGLPPCPWWHCDHGRWPPLAEGLENWAKLGMGEEFSEWNQEAALLLKLKSHWNSGKTGIFHTFPSVPSCSLQEPPAEKTQDFVNYKFSVLIWATLAFLIWNQLLNIILSMQFVLTRVLYLFIIEVVEHSTVCWAFVRSKFTSKCCSASSPDLIYSTEINFSLQLRSHIS